MKKVRVINKGIMDSNNNFVSDTNNLKNKKNNIIGESLYCEKVKR